MQLVPTGWVYGTLKITSFGRVEDYRLWRGHEKSAFPEKYNLSGNAY